ncbi:MAG TPA: hypothetical protein VFG69_02130 [Nannocystaceae bacterium]|nr:hypothetical protein [Nannocystaceae bacterium]
MAHAFAPHELLPLLLGLALAFVVLAISPTARAARADEAAGPSAVVSTAPRAAYRPVVGDDPSRLARDVGDPDAAIVTTGSSENEDEDGSEAPRLGSPYRRVCDGVEPPGSSAVGKRRSPGSTGLGRGPPAQRR